MLKTSGVLRIPKRVVLRMHVSLLLLCLLYYLLTSLKTFSLRRGEKFHLYINILPLVSMHIKFLRKVIRPCGKNVISIFFCLSFLFSWGR
jgi:hypothetical protein